MVRTTEGRGGKQAVAAHSRVSVDDRPSAEKPVLVQHRDEAPINQMRAEVDRPPAQFGQDLRTAVPSLSILVIDGDRSLTDEMSGWLDADGHRVIVERSVAAAFSQALRYHVDAIVAEVDLPDGGGIELIRALRRLGVAAPVLMYAADGCDETILRSLDAGADAFLPKPASFAIVAARLRALHRRSEQLESSVLRVGDLVLDQDRLQALRGDTPVDLTPAQAIVLEVLMQNVGRVVSRDQLSAHLPEGRPTRRSNVIDVHIRALRSKLDDPFSEPAIETVRGVGYRVRRPKSDAPSSS